MKELKDKEVILGLVLIILLGSIAMTLLIRREIAGAKKDDSSVVVQEISQQKPEMAEENVEDALAEELPAEKVTENNNELISAQAAADEKKETAVEDTADAVGLYEILGEETYKAAVLTERKQEDDQLKELYEYWDAYKLDAVDDIIRLERMQKISKELEGKDRFYYYGEVDRLGRPNGKGLAVYADNTYYFGEWKEGLRHGKGMWLQAAIYTEENKQYDKGVVEHSYNGQWSKDLPNGEGQEHFSYTAEKLSRETTSKNRCIANVIGGFKNGYYHGEMYIMTLDERGSSTDWSGTCVEGVWEPMEEGAVSITVWESLDSEQESDRRFHKIFPEENKGFGIIGLKKG